MFIVIEGSDASGKKTQSTKLVEYLKSSGRVAERISFPMYDSPTGKLVTKYLNGEFGPPSTIDPKIASTWYALDRYAFQPALDAILKTNIVVCDRYVESNMGHQGGKIDGPNKEAERAQFFEWLDNLEYETLRLKRPDIGFFLHVPWKTSLRLLEIRGAKKDGHEADENHLRMAEESYLQVAELYGWHKIECCNNSGDMRSVEEIQQEIISALCL